jgi:hypothetical protein
MIGGAALVGCHWNVVEDHKALLHRLLVVKVATLERLASFCTITAATESESSKFAANACMKLGGHSENGGIVSSLRRTIRPQEEFEKVCPFAK